MNARRGIICAGNWIVDVIQTIDAYPGVNELTRIRDLHLSTGGGAANVASDLAASKLGLPVHGMGCIGDDPHGRFVLDRCVELGITTDGLKVCEGVPTAHTHVMSVPGKSRTFFYNGGANDVFAPEHVVDVLARGPEARFFYLGYPMLLARMDALDGERSGAADALAAATTAGLETVVDLVSVDHPEFAGLVAALAPHTDHLFLNEIEACRALGLPAEDHSPAMNDDLVARLLGLGIRKSVILHTPDTAVLTLDNGITATLPPAPLPDGAIRSSVGAGDGFCAGALYAMHEGAEPVEVLASGHRAAAAILQTSGSNGECISRH